MAEKHELTEEELEKANGGLFVEMLAVGTWFANGIQFLGSSEIIFRVKYASPYYRSSRTVDLDKFWYNGSEAWYIETLFSCNEYMFPKEIAAPAIVHEDKSYAARPF